MKLSHIVFATVLASISVFAQAQVTATPLGGQTVTHRHHAKTAVNPQDLVPIEQNLIAAIQEMSAALPIYDGHRVKSIHEAHKALVVIGKVVLHNTMAKPAIKDNVGSKHAHQRYTAQQIADSQAHMNAGLQALNTAQNMLRALGTNQQLGKPLTHAGQLDQGAIQQAQTALALHR